VIDETRPARAPFERQDKSIATFLFSLLKGYLQKSGLDVESLTDDTGLEAAALDYQGTLLSFDQCQTIIANALRLSRDPALGINLGRQETLKDFGMFGYAIASSSSGWDALKIASHYYRASTSLSDIDFEVTQGRLSITSSPSHPLALALHRFVTEEDFASILCILRSHFGEDVQVETICFDYPEPAYRQAYEDFFRCPLSFDAPVSQLCISTQLLDVRAPSYNPVTEDIAIKFCANLLEQQDANRSLISQVNVVLLRNPEKFPSIQQVADQLGLSERSLRRRLKTLNTSYRSLLNNLRKEIAIRYLRESNLSLDEIAALIGLSDSSSFYRSFKQWTGKAPSHYRR